MVLSVIGTICKFWLRVLNNTQTENLKTLADIVLGRQFGDRPLLTVSNHQSCVDDPVLLGLLPFRILLHPRRIRWIPGADEVMFYNERNAKFFGFGRVVPTIRGWGVYQKSVDFCLEKLNQGNVEHDFDDVFLLLLLLPFVLDGWIHLFAEGKVNMDHRLMRLKWGVARFVQESNKIPIVLPMYHLGMDSVLPNKKPYVPQVGQKVTLVIGSPIDLSEKLKEWKDQNYNSVEIRKRVTAVIQNDLRSLKTRAEFLHEKTLRSS